MAEVGDIVLLDDDGVIQRWAVVERVSSPRGESDAVRISRPKGIFPRDKVVREGVLTIESSETFTPGETVPWPRGQATVVSDNGLTVTLSTTRTKHLECGDMIEQSGISIVPKGELVREARL